MAKTYWLAFGSGNPATNTGLSPTFTVFSANGLTAIAGVTIAELPAGSGFYRFMYGPTAPIIFVADGGGSLAAADRYVKGTLDPIQSVDEKVGTLQDSFGSTALDPATLLGYAKRSQEFQEGNAVFTKATGIWDVYSRGSSTLLMEKTLSNTTTAAGKA